MRRKTRKHPLGISIGVTDAVGYPTRKDITLPERVVHHFGGKFPGVWKSVEMVRRRPQMCGLDGWQPWCYLPINVASGVLMHHTEGEFASAYQAELMLTRSTRLLAALSAWRMTKGVFSFDPTVLREMIHSDVRDGLPEECFLRLPEWCVYIATPGIEYMKGVPLHGFFAYVDDHGVGGRNAPPELNLEMLIDPSGGPAALREMIDASDEWIGEDCAHMHACVDLTTGSFSRAMTSHTEMLAQLAGELEHHPEFKGTGVFGELAQSTAQLRREALAPMIEMTLKLANLVLYLCADEADIQPTGLGNRRLAVRASETAHKRTFMAPEMKDWKVGWRIGAQLRLGQLQHSNGQSASAEDSGSSPRPHIRRAHWHSYWTGPLKGPQPQQRRVKWLPPIPVNVESPEMLLPNLRQVVDPRHPSA